MKILWLCNIMLPKIAEHIGQEKTSYGGWLTGLSNALLKEPDIELFVCFPISFANSLLSGKIDNLTYFGFPQNRKLKDKKIDPFLEEIIENSQPDIVHIFGTEFSHTFSMVRVCEKKGIINNVVISIQGLVSKISQHYFASLPYHVIKSYTFRDFFRKDNIYNAYKKMLKSGQLEIEVLQKVRHIIGRTTWDKACATQINPIAQYHLCNETLREIFYLHQWSSNECEPYSIFISQAAYPIKGLHYLLEAMPLILQQYPHAKIYIAGDNCIRTGSLRNKFRITSYGKYIKELIKKYDLENHIIFTGVLDEEQMCKRFLKSNVFVCPSSIENSPNSLAEAMILGVPSVTSNVGGIPDMLKDKEEGFLYQSDAPYMLAYYICYIFSNQELANTFSIKSREHALETHNKDRNLKQLKEIYREIIEY